MRILYLQAGESFHIGDDVRVTLVTLSAGRARIAVIAPEDIPVHREEIFRHIRDQRSASDPQAENGYES
ncbi:MAG: carbon storage regulator [Pseudomonadales bacterium]